MQKGKALNPFARRYLTPPRDREAEELHWVTLCKPTIGDILGTSPRTENKRQEHILESSGWK